MRAWLSITGKFTGKIRRAEAEGACKQDTLRTAIESSIKAEKSVLCQNRPPQALGIAGP